MADFVADRKPWDVVDGPSLVRSAAALQLIPDLPTALFITRFYEELITHRLANQPSLWPGPNAGSGHGPPRHHRSPSATDDGVPPR